MGKAIAIGVIVGVQEYRPERALAALRQMLAPVARVAPWRHRDRGPGAGPRARRPGSARAGDKVPAE